MLKQKREQESITFFGILVLWLSIEKQLFFDDIRGFKRHNATTFILPEREIIVAILAKIAFRIK